MRDFHSQLQRAEAADGDSELFTHNPLYRRMDSDENKGGSKQQKNSAPVALPPVVQSGNAAAMLDPIAKFFISHTKHGRASIQAAHGKPLLSSASSAQAGITRPHSGSGSSDSSMDEDAANKPASSSDAGDEAVHGLLLTKNQMYARRRVSGFDGASDET
jgi:hypothetical protein